MFNFGALARARAGMLKGAAEGDQERERRAQEAADAKRAADAQAFQQWATLQQMQRAEQQSAYARARDAAGDRRTAERDQLDAIQSGGEAAPEMVGSQLLAGLNAMRGSGGNTAYRMNAPRTTPFRQNVAGVDVSAEDMGGPTYGTAGGRTFRFDRQRGANAKARQDYTQIASQDARDRHADQRAEARDARATARQLALLAARGFGGGGAQGGRPVSANIADSFGTYNALIGTAEDALGKFDDAVQAGKNVTGGIRGRVTGSVGQFFGIGTDPQEVSARAALANVASSIMKDRSGGAITPQEFVRLEPFLPSKNDPEETARQKLVDLTGQLQMIRDERLSALEGSGFNVSGLRPHQAAPVVPGQRRSLAEIIGSTR